MSIQSLVFFRLSELTVGLDNQYIDFGKPKSVASVVYLDAVNNYTVIQHVRQIVDDFVVSAIAPKNVQNLKCYFCQRLRSPFFCRSFTSPLSITLKEIQQSISLNPVIKLNERRSLRNL